MNIKKLIAPIIITVIMLAQLLGSLLVLILTDLSLNDFSWLIIVIGLIPLFLAGVSIFVLIERIKEIRSGEEDDLSKY